MSRHLLTHVVLLGLLAACGGKEAGVKPTDPGTTTTNSRIKITAIGATRVTVAPRRTVSLSFNAALANGGTPVAGLQVSFSLQGAGGG